MQAIPECTEYFYGFCTMGPSCPFLHVQRPPEEAVKIDKIPQLYIEKVSKMFSRDALTNISQLQEYF
jgi:hypothetical protein